MKFDMYSLGVMSEIGEKTKDDNSFSLLIARHCGEIHYILCEGCMKNLKK
ncbi:MAG: hypothetical protein MUO60_02945 [Clostridiaceae bacterium]|nr:hypothetical protein [Clostridiaceae bacterium]